MRHSLSIPIISRFAGEKNAVGTAKQHIDPLLAERIDGHKGSLTSIRCDRTNPAVVLTKRKLGRTAINIGRIQPTGRNVAFVMPFAREPAKVHHFCDRSVNTSISTLRASTIPCDPETTEGELKLDSPAACCRFKRTANQWVVSGSSLGKPSSIPRSWQRGEQQELRHSTRHTTRIRSFLSCTDFI